MFIERYASTGVTPNRYWPGTTASPCSLDLGLTTTGSTSNTAASTPTLPATGVQVLFGYNNTAITTAVADNCAHAFTTSGCLAGLGDGSVRDLNSSINNLAYTNATGPKYYFVLNWAGDPLGYTGNQPAPPNW